MQTAVMSMDGQNGKNVGITPHIPSDMAVPLLGMKPTTEGLSALRESWMDKIIDLVSGVPPKVPPFRMINHQIRSMAMNAPTKRLERRHAMDPAQRMSSRRCCRGMPCRAALRHWAANLKSH